jgi:hypothetical protein
MERIPQMVSMENTSEKNTSTLDVIECSKPMYPYGLSICLTQPELDKLDIDHTDWSVGDLFHLHAMAKITSISSCETSCGNENRVEMQIIALTGENEEEENREEEKKPRAFRPSYL